MMSHGDLADRRTTATDFDTSKYWRGMTTNDWRNAASRLGPD